MLTALIGSHGLVAGPTTIRSNTRSVSAVMKDPKGWPNFKETQVQAFEKGERTACTPMMLYTHTKLEHV